MLISLIVTGRVSLRCRWRRRWASEMSSLPLRGRDQILAKITGPGPRVWVVYGLGGCGKTRLALEVAYEAQQDGVAVWWVSAADPASLVAGMRAVGRRLGVSDAELEHGDATDVIWQHLTGRADRWLLVMDNADDPQVLAGADRSVAGGRGWLRPVSGQAGRVVVTSRDGRTASWGAWCHRHRLGVLPPDQAAAVLADHAGHHPDLGSDDDARGLAVRLGGLPLALKIAGAYLADAVVTPPVFAEAGQIRSYRQYQQAIDSGDFDTVFPAAGRDMTQEQARELIGRTWDLHSGSAGGPADARGSAAAAAARRVRGRPAALPAVVAPGHPGRQPAVRWT